MPTVPVRAVVPTGIPDFNIDHLLDIKFREGEAAGESTLL